MKVVKSIADTSWDHFWVETRGEFRYTPVRYRVYPFEDHDVVPSDSVSVSVVRTPMSYGGHQGLWEIAVFVKDAEGEWVWIDRGIFAEMLDLEGEMTDDVNGWMTPSQVVRAIARLHEIYPDHLLRQEGVLVA